MATGIESVLNPEVAGGGAESRILYLENTATEADVQDGLNSADYDIVLLQGGVWASAFSSDLTVPEGKLLIGAAWGGDLDDNANPPHITFDSDAQLLVSGQIENLSLIFDAANTTDLIVGTMGIGHRIYVYTSDGAWHGQYALTGTWRSFTSFGITGLNGLNPARLTDVTEGWAIFQKGYINPGDTVNARGINLAPVGALEAYMDFRDIEIEGDHDRSVYVDTASDFSFSNIRYSGFSTTGSGFTINDSTDFTLRDIVCQGGAQNGFQIVGASQRFTINGFVGNNEKVSAGRYAFLMNSGVIDFAVSNVEVHGWERNIAIYASFSSYANFVSQDSTASYGIWMDTVSDAQFSNFYTYNCWTSGINIDAVTDSVGVNIHAKGSQFNYGIQWSSSARCVWSNLQVEDNNQHGIFFSSYPSYDVFVGVYAYNNGGKGLWDCPARYSQFSSIHAYNNGSVGIEVDQNARRCTFTDIYCQSNTGAGFVGQGIGSFAYRCLLRNITSHSNGGANVSLAGNWTRGKPGGGFYISSSASTTTTNAVILPSTNWYKMAGTTTLIGLEDEFDDDQASGGVNNRLKYLGDETKVFEIECTISARSDTNNTVLYASFYKNGVTHLVGSIQSRKIATAGDVGNMTITFQVSLATNEYIEVFLASDQAGAVITADYASCRIREGEGL